MSIDELLQAVNAAGFTPATLTAFLVLGNLTLQVGVIDAQIRNAEAARTTANQLTEAEIQDLNRAKKAKQDEIDALGQ